MLVAPEHAVFLPDFHLFLRGAVGMARWGLRWGLRSPFGVPDERFVAKGKGSSEKRPARRPRDSRPAKRRLQGRQTFPLEQARARVCMCMCLNVFAFVCVCAAVFLLVLYG